MNQMRLRKLAIAGSAFACAALLSFSWSEQRGVSLSIESAQARVGRPLTPVSVAGVARRQNRRAYRYGAAGMSGPMAVDYASISAAEGTTYAGAPYAANAYAAPPAAIPGSAGWYITGNGMACTSGMWVTGGDGFPFGCP